jgi:hypothetical protein
MGYVLLPATPRRALPYFETAREIAARSNQRGDVFHRNSVANAEEALGHALLATGERQRGLELLRRATQTFEQIAREWPQNIDYRFALIRALNGLGDALPISESSDFYHKAFRAAEPVGANPSNVRDLMNRAEVNRRWPRWNASAPAEERQRRLDIARQALLALSSYAPNDRAVQKALADVQRSSVLPDRESLRP